MAKRTPRKNTSSASKPKAHGLKRGKPTAKPKPANAKPANAKHKGKRDSTRPAGRASVGGGTRKPAAPRKRPSRQLASRSSSDPPRPSDRPPRLQKVLAAAGIASRRDCEDWIREGRVEIDGEPVTELGVRVDPLRQQIRVDGELLPPPKQIYYVVNKPDGAVSTNRDPWGRMRVIDLVPDGMRLFTVGRLDKASEGLMLVTNDGELANRLAHPRYGIEKIYRVMVAGHPTTESLHELRRGIYLAEGIVRVARLTIKSRHKQATMLEMVLTEGRNREIRRMAARIGHKVLSLKRIALGTLRLGTMPAGAYRPVDDREIAALRRLVSRPPAARSPSEPARQDKSQRADSRTAPPVKGTTATAKRRGKSPRTARRLTAAGSKPRSPSPGKVKGKSTGRTGARRTASAKPPRKQGS